MDKENTNSEGDGDYSVKYIHTNVIETVFGVLPTEQNDRRREQEKRRKFKEKLLTENPCKLIIDSSYIGKEGQPEQQYTNTILVTEEITWWQDQIEATYGAKYDRKCKDLSGGIQTIFRNSSGYKILSFSYYPSKNKFMVQGNHDDLKKWIKVFTELAASKETLVQKQINDEPDNSVREIQGAQDPKDDQEPSGPTDVSETSSVVDIIETSVNSHTNIINAAYSEEPANEKARNDSTDTIAAEDSVLFHSFNDTVNIDNTMNNEDDDPMWSDIPGTNKEVPESETATEKLRDKPSNGNKKRLSGRPSVGIRKKNRGSDSVYLTRINYRLDTIEGILNGLQGGILQVVEGLQEKKDTTNDLITVIGKNLTEKLTTIIREEGKKKPVNCSCGKELNNVKELISKTTGDMVNKVKTIIAKEGSTEHSELVEKVDKMMDKFEAESGKEDSRGIRESIKSLKEPLRGIQLSLSKQTESIHSLDERITQQVAAQNKDTATLLKTIRSEVNNSLKSQSDPVTVSGESTSTGDSVPSHSANLTVPVPNKTKIDKQEAERSSRGASHYATSDARKVLLVGDSTTKLIDKRRLLRQGTISKTRAATIDDAHYKISSHGGQKEMDKIIFSVGLNDLRNGSEIQEIVEGMKYLIDETLYRHPRCFIYICSILPVGSSEVAKQKIIQANAQFERLQKSHERVFYIDISTTFLNQDHIWSLFDDDKIHPNAKGTAVMMNCIRRKVQQLDQQHSLRTFISKPATPSTLSFAECVSASKSADQMEPACSLPPHSGLERTSRPTYDHSKMGQASSLHRLMQEYPNAPQPKMPDIPPREMFEVHPYWTMPYPYSLRPRYPPVPPASFYQQTPEMARGLYPY